MPRPSIQVLLEWQFSPPDFFEEEIVIVGAMYRLTVGNGVARCEVASDSLDANPEIRNVIHENLLDRFFGAQLVSHKPFNLSESSLTRVNADSSKTHFVEVADTAFAISGAADVQVKDANGKIISDTRQERIDAKKRLADEISTFRRKDAALTAMIDSYNQSVRDPNNELVHLYEVRDAVVQRFGNESNALRAVEMSKKRWSRLGALSNNEPLRQGRHRGKDLGALRDATEAELAEARQIARDLIEAYLRFLRSASI